MGLTHCMKLIPIKFFIMIQLVVFLPLVLIRDLAKLSSTALIADGFILVGLVYIFSTEISLVAERGIADIQLFNPKDFSLFVGCVLYFSLPSSHIDPAFPVSPCSLSRVSGWSFPLRTRCGNRISSPRS